MKLLPKNTLPIKTPINPKVRSGEPLSHGMDAAVIVALFFGLGFLLDRVVGTTPLFMIVMTIFGAIGVFVRFWYRYDQRMSEHEAVRHERAAAQAAARRKAS